MLTSPIFGILFALLGAFLWLMVANTVKDFKNHKPYFPRQKMDQSTKAFVVVSTMAGALSMIAAALILLGAVKE